MSEQPTRNDAQPMDRETSPEVSSTRRSMIKAAWAAPAIIALGTLPTPARAWEGGNGGSMVDVSSPTGDLSSPTGDLSSPTGETGTGETGTGTGETGTGTGETGTGESGD